MSRKNILTLTPNEDGQLVLGVLEPVTSPLPVDLSFLDETFPHGPSRYTWREMIGGSPNGGRDALLRWASKNERRTTPRGEYVDGVTAARARFILAVRALSQYEF